MVFNKVTLCLFVLGLIAVSAYPTEKQSEKSEVEVQTTLRSLSDDVQEDGVVTTEQAASDVQADDAVVTTSAPVVRSEDEPQVKVIPEAPEVETKVIPEIVVPVEKTSPVVVAEVVGEKIVPVVEVVEIVPVPDQTAAVSDVKSVDTPKANTVEASSQ